MRSATIAPRNLLRTGFFNSADGDSVWDFRSMVESGVCLCGVRALHRSYNRSCDQRFELRWTVVDSVAATGPRCVGVDTDASIWLGSGRWSNRSSAVECD